TLDRLAVAHAQDTVPNEPEPRRPAALVESLNETPLLGIIVHRLYGREPVDRRDRRTRLPEAHRGFCGREVNGFRGDGHFVRIAMSRRPGATAVRCGGAVCRLVSWLPA